MSHTLTPALGLTKATALTGEPWAGGAVIADAWDILDRQFVGRYNVLHFGAKGDGTADDTAAIQSALSAAGSAAAAASPAGALVIIPPGKYKIAAGTRLTVRSGVTIEAYGAYIFKATGATVGLLANFVVGVDSFTAFTGNSHIKIYGGVWDGQAQNAPTDAAYDVIDFNHGKNILLRDVEIRNVCSDHALEFNSVDGGRAIDCKFFGFRDATGLTRQFSEAVQIDLAVSGSSSIGTNDGTHSRNITLRGCYAGPAIDGSGLGGFGKLVGSHTTAAGGTYENIRIIDCTGESLLDIGIGAYNWSHSVIALCTIKSSTSHGIRVTVPEPVGAGFSVLSTGVQVINNIVDGTSGSAVGIEILGYTTTAGVTNCLVQGNDVRNAGGTGIFAQLVDGVQVLSNQVDTPGSNGVNVTACGNFTIKDNWIRDPLSNYGIFLGQVTSPSTVSATDGDVDGNTILLGTGPTAAIRLATGTTGCTLKGNKVRKNGGSQTIAISHATGSSTTNWAYNNDLSGFGDVAATITVTSGTLVKTLPVGTNVGTNIY